MAEIVIAAAPRDGARANAIAEALAALGFDVAAPAPEDADTPKAVEQAACVVALWSSVAVAEPVLHGHASHALGLRKLVCAELGEGMIPPHFESAPRTTLDVRDRLVFKQRFEALVMEIERLTPTEGDADALPEVLARARAALGEEPPPPPPPPAPEPAVERGPVVDEEVDLPHFIAAPDEASPAPKPRKWGWAAAMAGMVLVLFGVGLGMSRVLSDMRDQPLLVSEGAEAPQAELVAERSFGLTPADLETLPWREAAAKIDPSQAERIKAGAANGEAFAQNLACLGHMAGVPGFLPSPAAAGAYCEAAAAQGDRSALYLSWALRRLAPHAAPIEERVARDRLAQAAQSGLVIAQVEYGLVLAPDNRAPLANQVEAGRLWLAAAEKDDPRAQFFYARWLRDSPAGPRDPSAAAPYLERAANTNQTDALHMLATLYRDGIGVARDPDRARSLYERAAARNFAPSMFNLADMLRSQDRERAVGLYRRLACMRDELQISAMSARRLRELGQGAATCG